MSYLEKVIYLTQNQYNTLASDGTVTYNGTTLTGINDDYLYITSDPITVNDITGVLPINKGGTGLTSIAQDSLLIGSANNDFTTIAKTTVINSSSTDSQLPTALSVYTYALMKTGGTLSGKLTLQANQYSDTANSGALNLNNSNIYGVNGIYTADASENAGEGINFYRDATHNDTLWIAGGAIYFVPNRAYGESTTAGASQKVVRMPASVTSGSALIADGTAGQVSFKGITDNATATAVTTSDTNLITARTLANAGYVKSSGVTKVSTGAGLTGGDITTTGTVKANLVSETKLGSASSAATEVSGRVYPVALDTNGKLAVNVPWTNVNSSYLTGITSTSSGSGNAVTAVSASGSTITYTLGNVAPATGSTSITTLGTITTGTWNGTAISSSYIGSHNHSGNDITSGTVGASYLGVMTSATSSTAGTKGAVPAPAAGDQVAFLQGDATWYKLNARNGTGTGSIVVGTTLFGETSTASGNNSFASGLGTQATGGYTHTEGYHTIASNGSAHAEGESTNASGWISHAEGYNTIANHKCQHVFGEYNIGDTSTAGSSYRGNYIEIVGNGTATDARSNARTLDWEGNETISGYLCSKSSVIDASKADNNVGSALYRSTSDIRDSADRIISRQEAIAHPDGRIGGHWYVRNYNTNGDQVAQKGITMWMAKDGSMTYDISEPANFCSAIEALPLSGGIMTGKIVQVRNPSDGLSQIAIQDTNATYKVGLHLGSGGVNHGVYDFAPLNKWLIYANATDIYAGAINVTTAAKALSSIGAAASSHNHTISNITNWRDNFTCTLLWTNSSVTSNFSAQTIGIAQIPNYKLLLIAVRHSTGTGNYQMCVVNPDGNDGKISNAGYSDNGIRTVNVSGQSIYFSNAQHGSSSTANSYCIPYKIWGLA